MLIAFLLPFAAYLTYLKNLNQSYLNEEDDDDDDDDADSGLNQCGRSIVRALAMNYIYRFLMVCYNDENGIKVLLLFVTSIIVTILCTYVSVSTALTS